MNRPDTPRGAVAYSMAPSLSADAHLSWGQEDVNRESVSMLVLDT